MNLSQVECVVFDFDGVLVDSNRVKRESYFKAFADIEGADRVIENVLSTEHEVALDRRGTIHAIVAALRWDALAAPSTSSFDDAVEQRVSAYSELCQRAVDSSPEISGASDVLVRLSSRLPLYLCSATPLEFLEISARSRGWQPLFRGLLGTPGVKADQLALVAKKERLPAGQVLFVGDSQSDLRAARDAGCAFLGIVLEDGRFHEPPSPSIREIGELEGILFPARPASGRSPAPSLP